MRGAVLLGERQIEIRHFPDPTPGEGEVVLEMKASGICGSDLKRYRGPASDRPAEELKAGGHEPCGVVAAVGKGVEGVSVGDRVMQHHYLGCGRCRYCKIGYPQLCRTDGARGYYGGSLHGGHADYLLCAASTLVPLPDSLTYEEGASIACGTGTAYAALRKLDVSGRDTLVVYGQGPVGLSATLLGAAMGARVIAVDINAKRLAMAREHGASEVIDSSQTDPIRAVADLTEGEGADASIDCTGHAGARAQTVRSTRVFGRACFVGEGGTVTLEPTPDIIHRHLTLYGSWTFSTFLLEDAAKFVASRRVPLRRIITHARPLAEIAATYSLFEGGEPGKCVVTLP
jgi:threonine dehydrogenase-like Zn-dependent dehydrogenase